MSQDQERHRPLFPHGREEVRSSGIVNGAGQNGSSGLAGAQPVFQPVANFLLPSPLPAPPGAWSLPNK